MGLSRLLHDPISFLGEPGPGKAVYKRRKGMLFFAQGDPADAVFFIRDGKITTTVFSAGGKEAVVAILGNGDFFGEGCLAGETRRKITAAALTDCTVVCIEKKVMTRALAESPALARAFTSYLLTRNARLEADLIDQLFNSCEKRLARMLLILGNFGRGEGQDPHLAKISQKTLADMIGTTRPRVSVLMNKFRRAGHIEYGRTSSVRINRSLLDLVRRD